MSEILMPPSNYYSVVIVGGGAAGIAAASRLMEAGVEDLVVVEASGKIGGRLQAQHFGEGKVEMGAQFIHGEVDNVVYDMAKRWGIVSQEKICMNEADAKFVTNNGDILPEDTINNFLKISATIQEKLNNLNEEEKGKYGNQGEFYSEMMEQEFETRNLDADMRELGRDFMCWFSKLQANIDGSDALYSNSLEQEFVYQECEGDQMTRFKSGIFYEDMLTRLAHGLEDKLMLGEKVIKITRSNDGVQILTESGNKLNGKYIIVTVSLGVLKNDHEEMFEPPLPSSKIAAIENLGFGSISKIFVEYPTEWCNIDPKASAYSFIRRKESSWRNSPSSPWQDSVFGLYPEEHNPRVMMIWLSGPSAICVESMDGDLLQEQVHSLLQKYLSPHIPHLPRPVSVLATSWYNNPLHRGTYTFLKSGVKAPGIKSPEKDILELSKSVKFSGIKSPEKDILELSKSVGNLLFAGEATHPHYFSCVHGAVESGWREADRIIQILQS